MVSWQAATSAAAAVPAVFAFSPNAATFAGLMKRRGWLPEGTGAARERSVHVTATSAAATQGIAEARIPRCYTGSPRRRDPSRRSRAQSLLRRLRPPAAAALTGDVVLLHVEEHVVHPVDELHPVRLHRVEIVERDDA